MSITNILMQVIFFVFAISAIATSLVVITTRNPVKGVLFLVLTFLSMAGIWVMLQAEFLALILVVVYVGAVMTLFLFVVMMLNIDAMQVKKGLVRYLPLGVVIIGFILFAFWMVLGNQNFGLQHYAVPPMQGTDVSNTQALGMTLFTQYLYPFEVAGVLLLVAMIAAITLAHRGVRARQQVSITEQLSVRAEQRVRLVSMPVVKNSKEEGGE